MRSRVVNLGYESLLGMRFAHILAFKFGGLYPATTEVSTMHTFIHGDRRLCTESEEEIRRTATRAKRAPQTQRRQKVHTAR